MYTTKTFEKTYQKNQEYMKNICCFPLIFESKRPERKEKKTEANDLQKTFTFFSKLHLDSTKSLEDQNRKIATADKCMQIF